MTIRVIEADIENAEHGRALVSLIDSYAQEPAGQSAPLTTDAKASIVPGLRSHPANLILLAAMDDIYAGAAVCFWLFSTFSGKPLLNIHDLVVGPDYQNRGIGTALLSEIEKRARQSDCCKITLEVNDTNLGAKRLYERFGFGSWSPSTLSVAKRLV